MSHLKERKEKTCLNCNAELYGRFCHVCGQENLEPKETAWHLVTHFFNDITHFDGKFFSTVKYLIAKPGFLSAEYMAGRRASYLNPIRMYVFTSAFFFLIFFSLPNAGSLMQITDQQDNDLKAAPHREGISDWEKQKLNLLQKQKGEKDSAAIKETQEEIDHYNANILAVKKLYGDTSTRKFSNKQMALLVRQANKNTLVEAGMPGNVSNAITKAVNADSSREDSTGFLEMLNEKYTSVAAYDSIQDNLHGKPKDGFLKRMIYRQIVKINQQQKKDNRSFKEHFRENFLHSYPKIFFFSLPFFALILKFVYMRRKNYYYADHGIFAVNLYCAVFIMLLASILLIQLNDNVSQGWLHVVLGILNFATWLYMFFYMYKAMRRFYKQGRLKTILKYILISFLALFIDTLLLLIFLFISAISI